MTTFLSIQFNTDDYVIIYAHITLLNGMKFWNGKYVLNACSFNNGGNIPVFSV